MDIKDTIIKYLNCENRKIFWNSNVNLIQVSSLISPCLFLIQKIVRKGSQCSIKNNLINVFKLGFPVVNLFNIYTIYNCNQEYLIDKYNSSIKIDNWKFYNNLTYLGIIIGILGSNFKRKYRLLNSILLSSASCFYISILLNTAYKYEIISEETLNTFDFNIINFN